MARMSNKDLKETLKDIGLDLQDEGFHYSVSNVDSYTNISRIRANIRNYSYTKKVIILYNSKLYISI